MAKSKQAIDAVRSSKPRAAPVFGQLSKRFVLISDLHLHPWAAFAKGEGGSNSRLLQSLAVLKASLQCAQDLEVPWVFAGDIVHTAGYALNVVMSELTNVLLAYGDVPKIAVWGNHDARGVGGKIKLDQTVMSTLHRAVPNFVVLDPSLSTEPIHAGGLTFSGAGYQPRPEHLDLAAASDVGIYHQTVVGTKTPTGFELDEGIPGRLLLERHSIAVVGHVHHWQYHAAAKDFPGRMLLIPGSPEQHNFGDAGDHGWWVIEVPHGREPLAQLIHGGSPRFRTVTSVRDVCNDGNFYRVTHVAAGESLPANAAAIASAPTAVEQRNALKGAYGDGVLAKWMELEPPDDALDGAAVLATGRELVEAREVTNLGSLRLTRVMLTNFCSYAHATLDVKPGTRLVLGRGKDFPSNGAGKSTLFEAIFWALFGATTKGLSGDEVIRRGFTECAVILDFEGEWDAWLRVKRLRGKSSQLEVTYGTGDLTDYAIEGRSVNDVSEKLQKHLGVTPDLFKALGYFSQEDLVLFASATDGERKDMLADLIGLGAYQEASSAAGRKAEELMIAEQRVVALREAAEQRRESERKRFSEATLRNSEWQILHAKRLDDARKLEADFDLKCESMRAEMESDMTSTLGRALAAREEVVLAQLRAAEADAALPENAEVTQKEVINANTAQARALEDVRAVLAQVNEAQDQANRFRRKLQRDVDLLAGGECPTCGQDVSDARKDECLAPVVAELAQVEARVLELESRSKSLVKLAADAKLIAQQVNAGFVAWKLTQERKAALMKAQAAKLTVEDERDSLALDVGVRVQRALDQRRNDLLVAAERIVLEANPHASELAGTAERIAELEREVDALSSKRTELLAAVATFDYWRRGFSRQGVQSLLLDEVAGMFNDCRGAIFPALTQGVYDVQFSTLSQTKSGDARERTEFQVFERGKQVPYNSLSGGQRRRVDVGVMLTLVKAVSRWMQVPGALGVLVLDEVLGFLDESGAEGLMEALREIQEQVPAIFVVSHDSHLQALFPETIAVIQDSDGASRLAEGNA